MNQPRDNNRRKRNFKKKNKKQNKGHKPIQSGSGNVPEFINNNNVVLAGTYSGVVEISEKGYGFIRKLDYEFSKTKTDPFLFPDEVRYNNLKSGLMIQGQLEKDQKGNLHVATIDSLTDAPLERWTKSRRFELQTPIMPVKHMKLGFKPEDTELRVMDLIAPIGFGQRGLIVAPPRTGKTVLLKKIAQSIDEHYPDVNLAILLVDERPEEVTDFMRTTKGRVFASSNDKATESHVRISEMALGYVKRQAEMGADAVLLIDSLTRMGRAYNASQNNSGRTLSGGLDIRALEIPKKIFGSARAIEGGGTLTIIATALIETNSRMDDLIFEEFKGTGNMELVLDREIANDRVFPAINIAASSTRNEDKFIKDSMDERNMVRRYLLKKSPKESMVSLLQVLRRTRSNEELLNQIAAFG
jgi:transcription termination factor Rho